MASAEIPQAMVPTLQGNSISVHLTKFGNQAAGVGYMQKQKTEASKVDATTAEEQPAQQTVINSRFTRKLEGGRPHKVYDYMFIQMSMEQFVKEYAGRKILIINNDTKKDTPDAPNKNYQSANNHGYGGINQGSVSPRAGLIYQSQLEQQMAEKQNKQKYLSPNKTPDKNRKMFGIGALQSPNSIGLQSEPLDLNGLVKIKAYES